MALPIFMKMWTIKLLGKIKVCVFMYIYIYFPYDVYKYSSTSISPFYTCLVPRQLHFLRMNSNLHFFLWKCVKTWWFHCFQTAHIFKFLKAEPVILEQRRSWGTTGLQWTIGWSLCRWKEKNFHPSFWFFWEGGGMAGGIVESICLDHDDETTTGGRWSR